MDNDKIVAEAEEILRLVVEDKRRNVGAVSRYDILRWGAEQLHRLFSDPEGYFRTKDLLRAVFSPDPLRALEEFESRWHR